MLVFAYKTIKTSKQANKQTNNNKNPSCPQHISTMVMMGEKENKPPPALETIHKGNGVVAPPGINNVGEDDDEDYYMHSRMMTAAARRIVQLNQKLEDSQKAHASELEKITKFYEDKIAKLHRAQMYSVDRMGQRIDVLEEELASRTEELTRTQQELRKAVEKVVALQQEVSEYRPSSDSTVRPDNNNNSGDKETDQQDTKVESTATKRPNGTSGEERSYPSSAGSEGQFEEIKTTKVVFKKKSKKKRCKVESSNWDDANVIVPDSFMTAVDDASSRAPSVASSTNNNNNNAKRDSSNTTSGLSRFFQFGQRYKDVTTKPKEFTARPNAIEDFYDNGSNSSLPNTIQISGQR